ncbi:FtsX-like permease family protein [Specibacter cremeus]|uniref:FtsX-like permease family protein n=1 Tax=Specibacter cremeus TaxID=1629051 RepID=UPI000F79E1D1|nr:FtsX-like permease family protein [Specibacter cremeus]
MLNVALSQLRTHSRRFIAIAIAVLLAVAFLSATLMVNASTKASLNASLGQSYVKADLVISPTAGSSLTAASAAAVAATPGVAASYPLRQLGLQATAGGSSIAASLRNLPASATLEPVALTSGAWPAAIGQVAVDVKTAEAQHLVIGSTLALSTYGPASGAADAPRAATPAITATVTGIMAASADPHESGLAQFAATNTTVAAFEGPAPTYGTITVALKPGADVASTTAALAAAVKQPVSSVLTPEQKTTETVQSFTGGSDRLTIVLLAFAAVALLVSALVVSNTFSVLVAQRTRELALLRCVGASRRQIRNSVLLEALITGFLASVLGVAFAIGVMAVVLGALGQNPDFRFATLAVPPSSVIGGLVVGTLLTLVAALVPARAATAVAPLAALRPADELSVRSKRGRARLALGIALLLLGGAGLVYAGLAANLVVAVPSGAMSFVGLILAATLFVPRLVGAAGRLAAPAGVPGKMAAVNAVRNPRRTTATASALIIGVTLVTMMMAGAATARTALNSSLDNHFPVDVSVHGASFTDAQLAAAAKQRGVKALAVLSPVGSATTAAGDLPVYSISDAGAAAVLKNPANRPARGTVVMPKGTTAASVTVNHGGANTVLPVHVGTGSGLPPLVSASTIAASGAGAGQQVWISVDPSLDASALMALRAPLAKDLGVQDFQVAGTAIEKAQFGQVVDMLLLVVTGMLAVAVLIALIGVANTLSLSVLERTRENSLLRALGLTRGQLRGMLALEAVLIAGVSAIIGSVLGVVYGWLGAQSALGSFTAVTAVIPWGQVVLVILVAAAAGLLASVIPARRAARLSPVAGLAME